MMLLRFILIFSVFSCLYAQPEGASQGQNNPSVQISSLSITPSKYYFLCKNKTVMDISQIQMFVYGVSKSSHKYEKILSDLFDSGTVFPDSSYTFSLPIYLAMNNNLQELTNGKCITDKTSHAYILGLLCSFQYDEAKKTALNRIKNDKDNFGLQIMLGILSMRDKELFPYMEKAFEQNPIKTLYWLDWQMSSFEVEVPPGNEWDFLEAYFKMIMKKPDIFKSPQISPRLAYNLYGAIWEKYYYHGINKIIPEHVSKKKELELIKYYLQSIFKGRYPPRSS